MNGLSGCTNLVHEESEWQSGSESPSTGAYVGFLFACYSTPDKPSEVTAGQRDKGMQRPAIFIPLALRVYAHIVSELDFYRSYSITNPNFLLVSGLTVI